MRPKLPWALLAVSLSFNVFFIAGYLYVRRTVNLMKTPEGRVALVAEMLDLDDEQTEACMRIEARRTAALEKIGQPHGEELEVFWNEMTAENPDRGKIQDMLERSWEVQKVIQSVQIDHLIEHFAIMNPEQRRRCAAMIRERNIFVE